MPAAIAPKQIIEVKIIIKAALVLNPFFKNKVYKILHTVNKIILYYNN
jgi:hypothetical protein